MFTAFHRSDYSGFVSVYYLGLLLWAALAVVSIITIIKNKAQIMINLQEHEEYLAAESFVIHDIRCRLERHSLEDGSYSVYEYSYDVSAEGDMIYVNISGPVYESLEIEYDRESGMLQDYSVNR